MRRSSGARQGREVWARAKELTSGLDVGYVRFCVLWEKGHDLTAMRHGPHDLRLSDLDRDDFDIGACGRYRFQVRVNAGCPSTSACAGLFADPIGHALCGRP